MAKKKSNKLNLKKSLDIKPMKGFMDMFQTKKKSEVKKEKLFETNKKLAKLKLLIIFVKRGHGVAISDLLLENGAAMTNMFYAEGSRERYVTEILGGGENRREAVLAIVKDRDYKNIRKLLETRFLISSASNGILLTFDIRSMAGVLAYKYLSDYEGALKYGKK